MREKIEVCRRLRGGVSPRISSDFKVDSVSSSFMWKERSVVVRRPERHNGKDPCTPVFIKTHCFVPAKEKADVISVCHAARNAARKKASDREDFNMQIEWGWDDAQ